MYAQFPALRFGICSLAFSAAFLLIAGCGGGGGTSPGPETIEVSPSNVTVLIGGTQQFTAAVSNVSNSSVIWQINGTAGGNSTVGTISSTGLYTPPQTVPTTSTITVSAVSAANSSIQGSTMANLAYPLPTLSAVSPSSINAASSGVITITGQNFTTVSTVQLANKALPTTFLSSTQVSASVTSANTSVAGALALSVTNPSPGGGTSSPVQLPIVPVLSTISPAACTVGAALTLNITGGDAGTPGNNLVSFKQAGQITTVPAVSVMPATSAATVVVTVPVPATLSPATANSDFSAPATVTISVNGVAGPASQPLTVQPPPHAIGISPPSAEVGTSLSVGIIGAFTGFSSSSVIASDDPGLSISEISVLSPNLITAQLTLSSTLPPGLHTLTVSSGGGSTSFVFSALTASTVPVVLTNLSQTSLLPLAPVTLTGSGFTAGSQTSSSVVLRYSYAGEVAEIEVTPDSDTEIETFLPLLADTNTGSLYVGQGSVQVIADGRASASQSFSVSALPPNTGPVGGTTTAFLAAISSQLSMLQTEFPQSPGLSNDQVLAFGSLVNLSQANFQSVSSVIASAASGNVVTAPDGSTFTAATVDLVDRLLRSSNIMTTLGASSVRSTKICSSSYVKEQLSPNIETTLGALGQVCSGIAALNQSVSDTKILDVFAFSACGLALIPPLAPAFGPICGLALLLKEDAWLYVTASNFVCDAMPINLTSITANPTSLTFPPGASPINEMPIGNFSQSPAISRQILGEILMKYLKQSTQIFRVILQNKAFANYIGRFLQFASDQLWQQFLKSTTPATIASIPVQLTSDVAPLEPDPNSLVDITGYTVSPLPTAAGSLTLSFNLSNFRLLDAHGKDTDSARVQGNSILVTAGSVGPLSVIINGNGSVSFNPQPTAPFSGGWNGTSCTATCTVSFPIGASVTLTAVGNKGSLFGAACSGNTCSLTVDQNQSVAASFPQDSCATPNDLFAEPMVLNFRALSGASTSQELSIGMCTNGAAFPPWTAVSSASWLSLCQVTSINLIQEAVQCANQLESANASLAAEGELAVLVDTTGLSPGIYTASITINNAFLPVALEVTSYGVIAQSATCASSDVGGVPVPVFTVTGTAIAPSSSTTFGIQSTGLFGNRVPLGGNGTKIQPVQWSCSTWSGGSLTACSHSSATEPETATWQSVITLDPTAAFFCPGCIWSLTFSSDVLISPPFTIPIDPSSLITVTCP